MKKENPKIILGIFSVIVGIFIATQLKLQLELHAPVTIESLQALQAEINAVNDEISEINNIIKMKEEELELLKNIAKGDDNIIDILLQDINYNKTHSGLTALSGPGITIKMYDNPVERDFWYDFNDDLVHDTDILNIINDLRIAGAEAISINNERVISTSEIKCAGPTIRINGRSSGTPFVIKAIGDPTLLHAAVNAPSTYGDILKNVYQIGFETIIEDSVEVPAYDRAINYKYAKPLGKDD